MPNCSSRMLVLATVGVLTAFGMILATVGTLRIVKVEGASMNPTVCHRDVLLAMLTRHSVDDRSLIGRIVILKLGSGISVKRVVAVAGDAVSIERGRLVRNGWKVEEPYICEGESSIREHWPLRSGGGDGYQVVPSGQVFVLGDNRTSSLDSREMGFLAATEVSAIVLGRIWRGRKGASACDCRTVRIPRRVRHEQGRLQSSACVDQFDAR